MLKSIGMALFAAMIMASFAPSAQSAQEDVQKLWQASGYATPGKGMRTMKMMHMMDTNKDGKVSKEEFMAYYEMVWNKMDTGHLGQIDVNKWIGQ
ncbi:MAG TPA: EF-hand domain-containing protein [Burkholderiales bacterium]|nr:EF-hand domain-containing protein [Burkholderiales bacterium]